MTMSILVLPLLLAAPTGPVAPAPQTPPPKMDCSAPEFRGFDFWLGSWNVTVQGKPAGTNVIESAMQGCALIEHWTSSTGGHGTSLNFYDRRTKTWSQAWIDEGGNALHLSGDLTDGRMILQSAPRTTPQGVVVQRITWSKNADQSVRQVWESSTDGGKTWSVAFDGRYVRQ
jgi:hypothetical protein